MSPKERFLAALDRKPLTGRVPHFELVFFLTMEAFGKVHPTHRVFHQWDQMSKAEQKAQIDDVADVYIAIAEKYEHSAIFYQQPQAWSDDANRRCLDAIQEKSGGKFSVMLHGDCTFSVPHGDTMTEFSARMFEDPEGLKKEAQRGVEWRLRETEKIVKWGNVDTFGLCSDYCFNTNPFMSPDQFSEFVAPYLARIIRDFRDCGFHVIKHTDGNIMPILDQLVECNPHALHSIDPQGHVDIAEVKRRVGGRVCLIGNVSCAALQTGSLAEVEESVRYALESGMPGGGYIFSTSNCVYTGLALERYDHMLELWRKYGNYA